MSPESPLDEAVEYIRYRLSDVEGVSAVQAAEASIVVYVGGDAAREARSRVGQDHEGHPIVFRSFRPSESAGILTIYPAPTP